MEKTESKVVTVMPHQENARIKRMEMFGWNLQGRQDVVTPVHADSDATPKLFDNGYNVDTTIESTHYVKLHFVRSLDLPNLEQTKKLESQYPFNEPPQVSDSNGQLGCGCSLILVLAGLIALGAGISGLIDGSVEVLPSVIVVIVALIFIGWPFLMVKWENEEEEKRRNTRAQIFKRREEIIRQLKSLNRKS